MASSVRFMDQQSLVDMSGKHASVPNYKPGFVFTANAVKKLAGGGSVDCPQAS